VSEVIAVKGVALVGLLPPALQSLIVYGAALAAAGAAPGPAAAFMAFLTDPAHRSVWIGAGFEPPAQSGLAGWRSPATSPRAL
jgi:molybdate transport system substrate-binding protein